MSAPRIARTVLARINRDEVVALAAAAILALAYSLGGLQ